MSNSIETPIDIEFLEELILARIDIDSGYPRKIDIGIDIDFFEILKIDIGIDIDNFELNVNGNPKSIKTVTLVDIQEKLMLKYKEKGKWGPY